MISFNFTKIIRTELLFRSELFFFQTKITIWYEVVQHTQNNQKIVWTKITFQPHFINFFYTTLFFLLSTSSFLSTRTSSFFFLQFSKPFIFCSNHIYLYIVCWRTRKKMKKPKKVKKKNSSDRVAILVRTKKTLDWNSILVRGCYTESYIIFFFWKPVKPSRTELSFQSEKK